MSDTFVDAVSQLAGRFLFLKKQEAPTAVADVFDWAMIPAHGGASNEHSMQIRAMLAITVEGHRHYGLLHSVGMGDYPALEFLNHSEKPATLLVRYNPKDPDEMIVMPNDDHLPFEIGRD